MNSPQENVSLRDKTTFRIGGTARYFYTVSLAWEVSELIAWANKESLPVAFLGNGSNVLVILQC